MKLSDEQSICEQDSLVQNIQCECNIKVVIYGYFWKIVKCQMHKHDVGYFCVYNSVRCDICKRWSSRHNCHT